MTIKQQGGVFGRNPTFSTLTLDGGNGFGVGDLNVAGFSNFNGRVTVTDDHFRVVRSANTSRLEVGVDATSAYLKPSYSSGGTRDLRFLSINTEIARITANGLTFNGDTAAANALDDYEEGTWTPVVSDATSGGNTASGTFTGEYTKIGNVVTVNGSLININTSGMTSGNTLRVQGLPYLAYNFSGTRRHIGPVFLDGSVSWTAGGFVQAWLGDNTEYVSFVVNTNVAGSSNLTVGNLTSGSSDIFFSLAYYA